MPKKIIDISLSSRQTSILFALVKEYCDTSDMLGSKELQEKYNFKFSSATIRNEISTLRDKGYLYQPFTNSASRPTELAFKIFVNQILGSLQVTTKKQKDLDKQLETMQAKQAKLSKEIAKLLALNTGGIGFAVTKDDEAYSGTKNLFIDQRNKVENNDSISHVLDFLDNLEENKKYLLSSNSSNSQANSQTNTKDDRSLLSLNESFGSSGEVVAYFNGDNPVLSLGGGYAMVATEIILENGEKSVIGMISPVHLLTKKKSLETVKAINKALNKNLD
jgi:transcriptional regulator of heat shock response